mmetsp:Transcript_12061/g.36469  ORF Transcript_12061/g.36469 Transcript_12061/m.36469 type:complete len:382 (+) Transcript_12061:278-1423(+)
MVRSAVSRCGRRHARALSRLHAVPGRVRAGECALFRFIQGEPTRTGGHLGASDGARFYRRAFRRVRRQSPVDAARRAEAAHASRPNRPGHAGRDARRLPRGCGGAVAWLFCRAGRVGAILGVVLCNVRGAATGDGQRRRRDRGLRQAEHTRRARRRRGGGAADAAARLRKDAHPGGGGAAQPRLAERDAAGVRAGGGGVALARRRRAHALADARLRDHHHRLRGRRAPAALRKVVRPRPRADCGSAIGLSSLDLCTLERTPSAPAARSEDVAGGGSFAADAARASGPRRLQRACGRHSISSSSGCRWRKKRAPLRARRRPRSCAGASVRGPWRGYLCVVPPCCSGGAGSACGVGRGAGAGGRQDRARLMVRRCAGLTASTE